MGLREDFLKRIEKKEAEIAELQILIVKAESYIQALQDSIKALPKNDQFTNGTRQLRQGSDLAKARLAILAAGRPLPIEELLVAIGKEATKENRTSLSGSIGSYVRKDTVFTRPQPNTFGLIELNFGDQMQQSDPGEVLVSAATEKAGEP